VRVGAVLDVGSPKTHELRSAGFRNFLATHLGDLSKGKWPRALIFGDSKVHRQRPRSSGASRSRLMRALTDAGLPAMMVHDPRHTAASLAIASGANLKAVQ